MVHSESRTASPRHLSRKSLARYLERDEIFEITRRGFAYYHQEFGNPSPFAKYDQLFVPEFNAGAMENAGAVTSLRPTCSGRG